MSFPLASRVRARLAALAASALTLLVALAVVPAVGQAATTQTATSANGQWRAEIHAGTTNLWFYKSIGAAVKVQQLQFGCTAVFCIGGQSWHWVDAAARSIDIHDGFTPWPPSGSGTCPPDNCVPPAPPRDCHAENTSGLDCSIWGVMFSFDPNPSPGRAQLNAKSVTATGRVVTPDGQAISLGPVQDNFWF